MKIDLMEHPEWETYTPKWNKEYLASEEVPCKQKKI